MSRTDRRDIVRGLGALGLFGAVAMPGAAWAQNDLTPPLPNVLLLVDSSGSMERMIDGTMPENVGAACTPGTPMSKDKWNRWATLVQVLTGDIENFSCQAIDRKSQAFVSEYTWNGVKPYDFQYHLPFHRLVSNDCVAGPGAMDPTNWFDWPAPAPGNPFLAQGALKYHSYTDPNAPCATPFKATSPGLLDTFINQIRFGLMTIDSLPDKGTGASGTSHNAATGMAGQWSYYQDWDNGGTSATGQLPGCQFGVDYEVGTRNPAAPAWEGRLISFGHYDAGVAELTATNNQIQEALLSMRPHGRTSLGGAFQDTEDFFVHDDFPDPKNPGQFLGPAGDPFFTAGCRPSYVILLSDGESEAELRPDCTAVNGCPFSTADTIAGELATLSPMPVQTYVVGFGVQQQGNVDCATLDATAFGPGGVCASPAANMKACCTLAQIAVSGGTGHAFFASDVSGLAQSLSQILSQISASSSTSRTLPVVGASANQASADRGFQLLSSFGTPISGDLWYGVLERKRYQCPSNGGAASQIDYDPLKGDAFQDNVNSNDPGQSAPVLHGDPQRERLVDQQRSQRPPVPARGRWPGHGHLHARAGRSAARRAFVRAVRALRGARHQPALGPRRVPDALQDEPAGRMLRAAPALERGRGEHVPRSRADRDTRRGRLPHGTHLQRARRDLPLHAELRGPAAGVLARRVVRRVREPDDGPGPAADHAVRRDDRRPAACVQGRRDRSGRSVPGRSEGEQRALVVHAARGAAAPALVVQPARKPARWQDRGARRDLRSLVDPGRSRRDVERRRRVAHGAARGRRTGGRLLLRARRHRSDDAEVPVAALDGRHG